MKYGSNIERQLHAGASKEEKARHNGVDTSRWGNDCPRIAVPDGWEDHQHTQQLVRKYLDNSFVYYDFAMSRLTLSLTKEEHKVLHNWLENGRWVVRKHICINRTFKGLCIEVRVRKPEEEWDDDKNGLFKDEISINNDSVVYSVNSPIFKEVKIIAREEVAEKTKVIDIKDSYLYCNSLDITVEPVTINGKTIDKFTMPRKLVEKKGIKMGLTVEVRAGQVIEVVAADTTPYIKRVVD